MTMMMSTQARYSGNRATSPTFDDKTYFECINKIMKEVRNHIEYSRIYSEPRIKTGFRTKIYDASSKNSLLKVRMIVDKMFPDMFNVDRAKESWCHSILITPKDKSLFIKS